MSAFQSNIRLLAGVILAGALSGCEIDPEDPVFLAGTVKSPDGLPARSGTIFIERSTVPATPWPSRWQVDLAEFETLQTISIGNEGAWRAELLSYETQMRAGGILVPRLMRVSAIVDSELPPVQVFFAMEGDDAELPPLQQWNGRTGVRWVAAPPGVSRLVWTQAEGPPRVPPPPLGSAADVPQISVDAFLRNDEGVAYGEYRVHTDGITNTQFEAVAEDFRLAAHLLARTTGTWIFDSVLRGPAGGRLRYELRSSIPGAPFASRDLVPFTRGVPCPLNFNGVCPLTDGRLTAVRPSSDAPFQWDLPEAVRTSSLGYRARGIVGPGLGSAADPSLVGLPVFVRFEGAENWVEISPLRSLSRAPPDVEHHLLGGAAFDTTVAIRSVRIGTPELMRQIVYVREIGFWACAHFTLC